jgi:anti-sigma-K factor RskA
MTEQPAVVEYQQAASIARSLVELLESARLVLRTGPQSAVLQKVSDHLGVDAREATVVGQHWQPWEHVSVHRGVAAFLSAVTPQAEWFGLAGVS